MKIFIFQIVAILGLAALTTSCCTKTLVLQSPVVSMTKAEARSPLKEGKEISTKWCTGDQQYSSGGDDSELGLIDEVTAKAQKENKADYLMNARFFQSCSCMIVEANAAFAKGGSGGKGSGKKSKSRR